MDNRLEEIISSFQKVSGKITLLTGAGISAESGLPTFRGKDGYWKLGSKEYRPEEMATMRMFRQAPYEVWYWYLYRRSIYGNAEPNQGHTAIAELERIYQNSFTLITQNVDGLHLKGGNSPERTFQIHGNINFMRCLNNCSNKLIPIPKDIFYTDRDGQISEEDKERLVCPDCGSITRPHILWFDESYNEQFYRFETSIKTASETDLLIVVGTSGGTTLPIHIGSIVTNRGGYIIDINLEENRFSDMAKAASKGCALRGKSGDILPKIAELLSK
ncbi:MAG: RNA polymerase subunit sigma [Nitrospinae bacterium]|nr:RNA polymerase subunit sigma [Nitrospinota bacterium]